MITVRVRDRAPVGERFSIDSAGEATGDRVFTVRIRLCHTA